jgi:drug/metabolite transporter superfamily protein YnfA
MNQELFGNLSQWLYPAVDLMLFVVVLVKYRQRYWGRLLAVATGVNFLCSVYWRLLSLAHLYQSDWYESTNMHVSVLNMYGVALMALALTSVPRGRRTSEAGPVQPPPLFGAPGRRQNPWLLALLVPVTVNIYWIFWLYRTVKEIRQFAPDEFKFTPGQTVGYMFIPLFNIYWLIRIFIALPRAVGRLNGHLREPQLHSAFAVAAVSIFLIVGFIFNALASQHYAFFIIGELLFLTALCYTQRYLNCLWQAAVPAAPTPV